MQTRDDETLLQAYARQGDEAAFRELARRYGGLVYAACLREVRRADLAEDAVQQVFVDLARKAAQVRARPSLVPWLYAAARLAGRNVLRVERRRPTVPLDETVPAPQTAPDDALFQALDALNDPEREAVVLRFVQGMSLAEIGRAQGVSEDAARMRVQRALKRLRTEYVPALAAPTSLLQRLAAVALPKPRPPMTTPFLLASGGVAALALVGAAATHRPSSLSVRTRAAPPAARAKPAVAKPPSPLSKAKEGAVPAIPTLDGPFTLVYRFAQRDLRTRAARDQEAELYRKDALPAVRGGRMRSEDLERSLAVLREPRPSVDATITLSFDGRTLYVESGGETFLVQASRTFDFPPRGENRSPALREGYSLWTLRGELPPIGASLPYVPFVRDGKTLSAGGAPRRDGEPIYNPGRLEIRGGKLTRVVNRWPDETRPYGVTEFSEHRNVHGVPVAGAVLRRTQLPDGAPVESQAYRLVSASERSLPADRFDPEAYLPEKSEFTLLLRNAETDRRFTYDLSKGSLDEQIRAFLAGKE